jgi:hypothetical protein
MEQTLFPKKNLRTTPLKQNDKSFFSGAWSSIIILATFGLIVAFRYLVLSRFSFKFTDSDQTIMWFAANEFSNGRFHEPCFYGQAYNSMIEALLAVPLIKLGLPIYKALPIISTLLSTLPFFLISLVLFLKDLRFQSFLCLGLLLVLPVEYDLITSLSRGFVPGLFFTALGSLVLLDSRNKWLHLSLGLFGILGYSLNPNSLILFIPSFLYGFLVNFKNKQFYIYFGLGALIASAVHFLTRYFYVLHPNYNLHQQWRSEFTFHELFQNVQTIDKFFNDLVPLFWFNGWLILVIGLLMIFSLFRNGNHKAAFSLLGAFLFILFSFGVNKILDGRGSIFFPYSRMFLGIPFLLGLYTPFLFKSPKKYRTFLAIIPLLFFVIKCGQLDDTIKRYTATPLGSVVPVAEIGYIREECQKLDTISRHFGIDLIILVNQWHFDLFNYACPAFHSDFPNTLRPAYERRTWRLIEDEKKVYPDILLIDVLREMDHKTISEKISLQKYQDVYLIKNNTYPTMALLRALGIGIRDY